MPFPEQITEPRLSKSLFEKLIRVVNRLMEATSRFNPKHFKVSSGHEGAYLVSINENLFEAQGHPFKVYTKITSSAVLVYVWPGTVIGNIDETEMPPYDYEPKISTTSIWDATPPYLTISTADTYRIWFKVETNENGKIVNVTIISATWADGTDIPTNTMPEPDTPTDGTYHFPIAELTVTGSAGSFACEAPSQFCRDNAYFRSNQDGFGIWLISP